MRIAYVTDQILPRSATDTHQTMAMASAMGRAGAHVTLVVPRRQNRRVPSRDELATYYNVRPTFDVQAVRSLYPSIRGIEKVAHAIAAVRALNNEYDLVYTRAMPVLISALMARVPVAYETYRPWPDQRRQLHGLFRWVGRQPHFLGAILHSKLATDSYARIGVPRERLLTAYNGHDPRDLEPVLSPQQARAQCGLPDAPTVVYTGRVSRKKGLDLVLDLAECLPDVTFVLVGSESDGAIERRSATLPNVRVVKWTTTAETIPYLYAADVLIIPPTGKPLRDVGNTVLPIKTFLYLAVGRAILAPGTPDLLEVLNDGGNAAVVTPDDPGEALQRLRLLLEDDTLRQRLANRARVDGGELTWERRAEKVLAFVRHRLGSALVTA